MTINLDFKIRSESTTVAISGAERISELITKAGWRVSLRTGSRQVKT